ncbi:nucleoside/nucleotide kinase family protein [Brucella pseudogrignonensis]|uniref:nucleoside/nucleotide kinase family protein n=1 Tax=Brucella pseudogrignonensis TaxID=419475 RepID=UPI000CFAC1E7|nr:nucleoside/nucleotide kinase family protein [Brucella pseudogrignonensis]MQP39805.1 nucleoside/nucleotide kinase family protein [Ochrobactrum sp. MYb237]PQZ42457.1 nucleoside/nucleotide kinase family protein [Brucella pseudogrignonensis]PRA41887.1 nucleoside/nucleotide kinase family protein [Brucella pseudogrignonensis]PRA70687.1 nucleoside/nucleotide kinase family protein [Brucella pseudogrignonensis]
MKPCPTENLPAEILSKLSNTDGRLIVAIAGPPGAGKSTISEYLRDAINKGGVGPAVIVPMDGFHLDNAILDERGLRSRKGSPPTFDCAGFAALLERLKNASEDVVIPAFDRTLDLARAGAAIVRADHQILLVEGNYLLLNQEPWTELASFFDMTIFLEVPFSELERRLIQRWLDHGHTEYAARQRALSNDIPNAELVVSSSRDANYTVTTA